MTLNDEESGYPTTTTTATAPPHPPPKHNRRRNAVIICLTTALLVLILLALIGFILGVTVFRVREPRTELVSATLEGVAPRLSFPIMKAELNITLNLTLLVHNQNHASFNGGIGRSVLLYQGNQVGDVELNPGLIPARGAAILNSNLTVEVDQFAEVGLASLLKDVSAGQITMESKTRIPGRVNFLGFYKKHMVSSSDCRFVIGVPDFKIRSQDCKYHNKL